MPSRRSFLAFAAFSLVAVATASSFADSPKGSNHLFYIQRSKNADEVHYDARVTKEGALDGSNPVDGYWQNKGGQGQWTRAELTWIQKRGYGWDTEATGNGTYALKLRAMKDRPMWIVKANNSGRFRVQTTIAGKPAFLTKLYVATDESGVMPKVLYVDVFGEDIASGGALTEHLVAK